MADRVWRKSSFTDNGKCVEVADAGGTVLVRNSNHPDRGMLAFPPVAVAGFVAACTAGEFDGLS